MLKLISEAAGLQFTQSFFTIVITLILALTTPFWFWRIPVFNKIRKYRDDIDPEQVEINYTGGVREFPASGRPASRVGLYFMSKATTRILTVYVHELTGAFSVYVVFQSVFLLIATLISGPKLSEGWHIILHYPIVEVAFLIVVAYLAFRTAAQWDDLEDLFRLDAR